MRTARALLATALLALAGCGGDERPPVAPPDTPQPPEVVAVHPASRATGVPYDATRIWAEFREPLDPASVTPLNVYLKLDTSRLPIAVAWDSAARRILITPLVQLGLARTYTVELSPNLRSAAGTALGRSWSWQFSTVSLFRPASPYPADGAVATAFTSLFWSGNAATAGGVSHVIFASTDSAAVAARSLQPFAAAGESWTPPARWAEDATIFWSVRARHLVTGEELDGPVWRFVTLGPASAEMESTSGSFDNWGWQSRSGFLTFGCRAAVLCLGQNLVNALSMRLPIAPDGAVFAGARVTFHGITALTAPIDLLSLRVNPVSCGGWYSVPPMPGDLLAPGVPGPDNTVTYSSDALGIHLALRQRRSTTPGEMLSGTEADTLGSPAHPEPGFRTEFVVRHYVPRAAAAR